MSGEPESHSTEFIESVDDMIGRHFSTDARRKIQNVIESNGKNWHAVEDILYRLIRSSIAHARSQVAGRKGALMTFDEAIELSRSRSIMITRPGWDIFGGIRLDDDDGKVRYWKLDNCDGFPSGEGWPYNPTDEDRAASDWMLYQAPQKNWVELGF
jgi:hypothetical protein